MKFKPDQLILYKGRRYVLGAIRRFKIRSVYSVRDVTTGDITWLSSDIDDEAELIGTRDDVPKLRR